MACASSGAAAAAFPMDGGDPSSSAIHQQQPLTALVANLVQAVVRLTQFLTEVLERVRSAVVAAFPQVEGVTAKVRRQTGPIFRAAAAAALCRPGRADPPC